MGEAHSVPFIPLKKVKDDAKPTQDTQKWMKDVGHYKALLLKVIDQTQRRVIEKEKVPSCEKIVSIFEDHTDIIIKGYRDVRYGHKVNLSTEKNGFITCFSIEQGNPADKELFLPVLKTHVENYGMWHGKTWPR